MESSIWTTTLEGQSIHVHTVPVLKDNLVYVVSWGSDAVVIDPGEAEGVIKYLEVNELNVKAVLNTHYHEDHVAGNLELKEKYECQLIAPSDETIEGVDQVVSDGEEIIIGPLLFVILTTPGHTSDHICYHLPDFKVLFSGDLLFASGCGKVADDMHDLMYESLLKVKKLPKETQIFCGHDYAKANLTFGSSVEPHNAALKKRLDEADFGLPTSLEKECQTNVFLREDSVEIRQNLDMKDASDLEVFTRLRQMKDQA